jgi:AcrR family transcriptional regulator
VTTRPRALSPRWEALRDEQEAAVAAAVIAIVAENPSSLSVATIAERAGISRQTFYKQFKTLELAVVVTYRRVTAGLGAGIGEQLAQLAPPANGLEQILRIGEALFEYLTSHPDVLRFTSFYDFSFRVNQMSAADRQEHPLVPPSEDDTGLAEFFRAGQRDGSIDPRLPVTRTTRTIATSLLGVIQRLQIQDNWTNGRDEAARETYASMIEFWAATLSAT